jgi:hypothetical protein
MVIPVDTAPLGPGLISIGFTDAGIGPSHIVMVRPVIGIPDRMVIPAVRMIVYHAVTKGGAYEIPVEGSVYIYAIIWIDIPYVVVIKAHGVIKDTHASQSVDQPVSIVDPNAAYPVHPAIEIVVNGYALYLYHCSVVVVLYKGVVIKTGIKGDGCSSNAHPGMYTVVDVKIKFSIRIYREGNPVLCKDEGIGIPVECR